MKLLLALYRNPFILFSHLAGALIAIFAPADILSAVPSLKAFANLVNNIFPVVGNFASRSKFPQISELYFAFMMCFLPAWYLGSLTAIRILDADHRIPDDQSSLSLIARLALLAVMVFGAIATFCFINPGYDFNLMPINRSRIALAVFGPVFAAGTSGYLLAALVYVTQKIFAHISLRPE